MDTQHPELPPNDELRSIYENGLVILDDGSTRPVTSATSPEEAAAMYAWLSANPPEVAVEIGMAYGISALTMLTAMEQNRRGKLISIDPYIDFDSARRSALTAIEKSGLAGRHEHRHEKSELALPALVADGVQADFVYIDGHHGFDHAFVDMFYADQIVPVGGVIAFDDSGWRSVHKVIQYLLRYRKYEELDVGIPHRYLSTNPIKTLIKRLQGRVGPSRYFRKTDEWKPSVSFFRPF